MKRQYKCLIPIMGVIDTHGESEAKVKIREAFALLYGVVLTDDEIKLWVTKPMNL